MNTSEYWKMCHHCRVSENPHNPSTHIISRRWDDVCQECSQKYPANPFLDLWKQPEKTLPIAEMYARPRQFEIECGVYEHKTTTRLYTVIALASMEHDESRVIIYSGSDNRVWVRPLAEFQEKFVKVKT